MIHKYLCFFASLVIFCGCATDNYSGKAGWVEMETVEQLWKAYPERLASLFEAIDLQQSSLEPVRVSLEAGDTVNAGKQLLEHFRSVDRSWVTTALDPLEYDEALPLANALMADSVIIGEVAAAMPFNPDGGWQWNYTGPEKDDEFGYSLNGHSYLPTLAVVWRQDGNAEYIKVYDRLIKDWVIHHTLPEAGDSIYVVLDPSQSVDWRDIGEVEWRTLEAGRRLGATWPQTFYIFQQEDAFSDAARLLMLSSIDEQASYLRQYHKSGHNWTTMEMNGLALVALAFPEFRAAEDWADYALQVMTREINRQVYPDGVQTEISTKTQWVALRRFESVANNFRKAGRDISDTYLGRIEEMYNYLAYSMRPDGHQPLNNDSDREDLRPRVLTAAEVFDRSDWQWIATNGQKGQLPEGRPTVIFPWAGIHVMRNGWEAPAHWSFFDTGPYGTGHQHRDKLHLSITAFGKDLLVDGGRYTHQDYFSFDPAIWRGYFRSSFSHNVLLVDGKGQNAGPERTDAPLEEGVDYQCQPLYDYAYGIFEDGFEGVEGQTDHSRTVLYLRDRYWLVLDHFDTDRARKLQALWHFAPSCQVTIDGLEAVTTNDGEANLRIVPSGNVEWEVEMVSGQEKPFIQGWYSENYGIKEPNPTLVYTTSVSGPSTFAWLLAPAEGAVPEIKAQIREKGGLVIFSITQEEQDPVTISLPLQKDASKVKVNL